MGGEGVDPVQVRSAKLGREFRGDVPKKTESVGHTHFPFFSPHCHDRKHMTGTHNRNCKQMWLLLNWKVKIKVCMCCHVWAEGTKKMESVFPSGLWNISRLTRDSGVCMPAFDRGVVMHRRNQPEEKYTDTLRHPSSSNQTRWQEQTGGFIWCLTTRLCLNIRKIECNHITHRNKWSRLCCFFVCDFRAWIYKGLGHWWRVWEGSCSRVWMNF